jgi:hypothetical protein
MNLRPLDYIGDREKRQFAGDARSLALQSGLVVFLG